MSEIVDCIAWVVRKIAWSFWVFLKFVGLRLLDLLGLIFNIAACCTIIRLPHMIADFQRMKTFWQWRFVGFLHVCVFIIDLPVLVMGLFVLLTIVRVPRCYKDIKENFRGWSLDFFYSGWDIRKVIIKHFFKSWIDIICIPTAFFVLISWRSVIFIRRMKGTTSTSNRRKYCFVEFFQLLIDILLLPFFVCILSWRLPFIIQQLRKGIDKDMKWNELRFVGLKEFMLLLLDIPCIVLFVITFFTWRVPLLVYKIRRNLSNHEHNKQMHVRKTIVLQFLSVFLDIPCIIASCVVVVSLWRLPSLIQGIKKVKNKPRIGTYQREFRIRRVCLVEFAMIFVDVLCFVGFLVVLCTLWRAYALIKNIQKYYKKYKAQQNDELRVELDDDTNQPTFQNEIDNGVNKESDFIEEPAEIIEPLANDESTAKQNINTGGINSQLSEQKESVESNIHLDEEGNEHSQIHTSETDNQQESDTSDHVEENEVVSQNNDSNGQSTSATAATAEDVMTTSSDTERDKTNEDTKKKTFSMWKIRKTIAVQFAFLLIDLPAIPLCVFLLITGLRTTKLLSELLASDFYMMFAITVYYQFLHFLVELVFIIIFLFLAIRKPIHLWTVLLEDEEHKSKRLLRHIMQWIPDIASDRHQYYDRLNQIRSLNFKQNIPRGKTLASMDTEFEPFLQRLEKVLYRLEKYEIEDEFVYLVKCAIFGEKKRTKKMIRYFVAEKDFLNRPNVDVHENNIRRLKTESINYEQEIDGMYEKLLNYKPDRVQLYESKSGLSLRTREETKKVLIGCLPRDDLLVIFGCLICILPIYRAPTMIKRLIKSWYNRVEILKDTLYEYGLDFLTILRMLFVLVFIYRAPFMFADVLDCIIKKRSWKAVRKTVKNYPGFIVSDVFELLKSLLSWKTPRFIFTAILFGALMPADLFLTVCKSCCKIKCFAFLVTALLYTLFIAFPFVYAFYGSEKIMEAGFTDVNIAVLCIFFVALLMILLMMVTIVARDTNKTFLLMMPEADYVRYSWYNFHVILFEALEFFQAIALIFKLPSIPMYGGQELSAASKYLLFSFVPFEPVFYTTVAFFIVWFFLCAAPIIFENILETYPIGTFGKRPSWRLLISIFANTLFLTFVENLVSFSACTYTKAPCPTMDIPILSTGNFTGNITSTPLLTYGINSTSQNATCVLSTFIEETSMSCWADPHREYAAFGLIALVWYTTTALIFDTQYGDPDTTEQDIGFSPIYNTVINVFKAMMVVAVTIITNDPNISLICLLILNVLSILFTFLFKVMFKFYPCNVPGILVWRAFTFISSCVVAIAVLVAYAIGESNSKVPLIVMGVGIGITLLVSIIVTIKLRRISDTERDREAFRKEIQLLEGRLQKNKWLLTGWDKKRKIWYRLVKSVRSAQKRDKTLAPPTKTTLAASNDNKGDYQTFSSSKLPPPPPPLQAPDTTPKDDLNLPPPPSFEAVENNQELYNITEVQSAMFSDDILKLEKNGRNLLFVLEKYIEHKAYSYSFFKQRQLWLDSAWHCNWTNLLQCLRVLNSNLQGTFDRPTQLDVSLAESALETDELDNDPQDNMEPPAPFVRQTKEMIANTSKECREKALSEMSQCTIHSAEWKIILEKILPDIPIIRNWEFDAGNFALMLRRPVTGTITDIEEGGNKLAKGARVKLGKKLSGRITDDTIVFHDDGRPAGSKGPANVTLKEVSFVTKNNKLYVLVNQKNKVPLDTVIASCKTIKWE